MFWARGAAVNDRVDSGVAIDILKPERNWIAAHKNLSGRAAGRGLALGFWDQPSLLSELRQSILKSLVTRNCLQAETSKLL